MDNLQEETIEEIKNLILDTEKFNELLNNAKFEFYSYYKFEFTIKTNFSNFDIFIAFGGDSSDIYSLQLNEIINWGEIEDIASEIKVKGKYISATKIKDYAGHWNKWIIQTNG